MRYLDLDDISGGGGFLAGDASQRRWFGVSGGGFPTGD